MKKTIFTLALFTLIFACVPLIQETVDDREKKIDSIKSLMTTEEKIDSIISLMTIEEKIGQMTQIDQQFLDNIQDISDYSI